MRTTTAKSPNPSPDAAVAASVRIVGFIAKQDFLVGREYFCQENLGNEAVRDLVDHHHDEYMNEDDQTKQRIREMIVSKVQKEGGRFLIRTTCSDCDGSSYLAWAELSPKEALMRVGEAFKNRKRRRPPKAKTSDLETEEKPTPSTSDNIAQRATAEHPSGPDHSDGSETNAGYTAEHVEIELHADYTNDISPCGTVGFPGAQSRDEALSVLFSIDSDRDLSCASGTREWECNQCSYTNLNSRRCAVCANKRSQREGSNAEIIVAQGRNKIRHNTSDQDCRNEQGTDGSHKPLCAVDNSQSHKKRIQAGTTTIAAPDQQGTIGCKCVNAQNSRAPERVTNEDSAAGVGCLNLSEMLNVIGIKRSKEGARTLLSSLEDNHDSVRDLMATASYEFVPMLRSFHFDEFECCRLKDFRIWFKTRYLRAFEKPLLTRETWLDFRESLRSEQRLSDSFTMRPAATAASGQEEVPIFKADGNRREFTDAPLSFIRPPRRHPSTNYTKDTRKQMSQQDSQSQMSAMRESVESLSLSSFSSSERQGQMSQPEDESLDGRGGKRDCSAVSVGSVGGKSSQKPPKKKPTALSDPHKYPIRNGPFASTVAQAHQGIFPSRTAPDAVNSTFDDASKQRQLQELPTINEDVTVETHGELADDMELPSISNSAPPSEVSVGSELGNVSSLTSSNGRDHLVGKRIRGAGSHKYASFGHLRSIIQKMKSSLSHRGEQLQRFIEISQILCTNDFDVWRGFNRKRLVRDVVTTVLLSIQMHSDDAQITEYGLATIAWLCADADESFARETYDTLIDKVIESAKSSSNERTAQESGSFALERLAGNEQLCKSLINAHGVPRVMAAMQDNLSCSAVQEQVCSFLFELSELDDCRDAIPIIHSMRLLVEMMKLHLCHVSLQKHGCILLTRLSGMMDGQLALIGADGVSAIVAGMQMHLSDAGMQESGISLLVTLAGHPQWNTWVAPFVYGHKGITATSRTLVAAVMAMQQHSQNAEIQANGCLFMARITADSKCCKPVIEAKVIQTVVAAMEMHPSNPQVHEHGYSTLFKLLEQSVSQDYVDSFAPFEGWIENFQQVSSALCEPLRRFAVAEESDSSLNDVVNSIQALADTMERHRCHTDMLTSACLLLANMPFRYKICYATILTAKVIPTAAAAIRRHSSHDGLSESACWLFAVLAKNRDCRKLIAARDVLVAVVSAMRQRSSDPRLQERGCRFLGNLAFWGDENCRNAILLTNGIPSVVSAMQGHTTHVELQENACKLLGNMVRNGDSARETIVEANAIVGVVLAMRIHSSCVALQDYACWLLGDLASWKEDCCKAIVAANGIPTVVAAMQQHLSHAKLQENACWLLRQLVGKRKRYEVILEANAISSVISAMQQHPSHAGLHEHACKLLDEVSRNGEFRKVIVGAVFNKEAR